MKYLARLSAGVLAHPVWAGIGSIVAIVSLIFAFFMPAGNTDSVARSADVDFANDFSGEIEVEEILVWQDNGRLGIPLTFPIVNTGVNVLRNAEIRVSTEADLPNEMAEGVGDTSLYYQPNLSEQFSSLVPNEIRKISMNFWIHDDVDDPPFGIHNVKIVIHSDDLVKSPAVLQLNVTIPQTVKLTESSEQD